MTCQVKKAAKSAGLARYDTGKPCRRGHLSERYTATGECVKCSAERAKEHVARHSERVRAHRLEYRQKNAERIREKVKIWKLENPDRHYEQTRRRRLSAARAVPHWFSELDQFVIVEAFDLARLRKKATGIDWDVDHMIPLAAKNACGLHCADNVQVIPATLNNTKFNRMIFTEPFEWLGAI